MLFDTHAHMDDRAFDEDRQTLLASLPGQGIGLLMNPGCSLESSRRADALSRAYDYIYAAVGSHPDAADEVDPAALEEYRKQPRLMIVCGAQGSDEPRAEGDVMRDWLIAHGVAAADIEAETDSFNTRQNLGYAQSIMDDRGLTAALIVTSDYHVPRALALCEQVGIIASGKGSPSKPEYFIKNHLREGLSWIKFVWESRHE